MIICLEGVNCKEKLILADFLQDKTGYGIIYLERQTCECNDFDQELRLMIRWYIICTQNPNAILTYSPYSSCHRFPLLRPHLMYMIQYLPCWHFHIYVKQVFYEPESTDFFCLSNLITNDIKCIDYHAIFDPSGEGGGVQVISQFLQDYHFQ